MTRIGSWRRVVAAVAAALLAGALVLWVTGRDGLGDGSAPLPAAAASGVMRLRPTSPPTAHPTSVRPAGRPGPAVAAHDAAPAMPRPTTPPSLLVIERIHLRMPVAAFGVTADGQMDLPTTPLVAAWYRYGPAPGDPAGASVIAGHVDTLTGGVGQMSRLASLHDGDIISVTSGSSVRRYSVTSVAWAHKSTLDLATLFDRQGPPQLHLVTCGGHYDRALRHYEDNVIVVASPVA